MVNVHLFADSSMTTNHAYCWMSNRIHFVSKPLPSCVIPTLCRCPPSLVIVMTAALNVQRACFGCHHSVPSISGNAYVLPLPVVKSTHSPPPRLALYDVDLIRFTVSSPVDAFDVASNGAVLYE